MNISTNSIKSRSKRTWSNSRYIDNHYDSKLHSTPFLPCGLNDSKQIVYSDIGLSEVRTNCAKLRNFQDLEQKNISVKELISKQGNWRPFLEFHEKSDDMIATIEYCTNCKEHQKSTRHDEEQYLQHALLIKQCILLNYPEIKVYLKPLVFDNDRHIASLFLQRRIGAFEIQLQMHGQQSTIFSKLQSKTWPDIREVLKAIHAQFKKTNLLIQLAFADGDANLKSISVTLQSMQTKTQASSQHLRPQSRLSENRSIKSTSIHRQRALSQSANITRYTEKSDIQGRVLFLNMPIDRYEVLISETLNNLPVNESISLQELIRADGAFHQITLNKPKISVLTVEIVGPQEQTDLLIPFSDTNIFVLQNGEKMLLKEVSGKSGIYEGFLEPGRYCVIANKYGYEQVQQIIEINGGQTRIKLQIMNKATDCSTLFHQGTNQSLLNSSSISKKKKIIKAPLPINLKVLSLLEVGQMYVNDYFSDQPIANAKIKIIDSILNKVITCTTHIKGNAKLLFNYLNKGTITIDHPDYYPFEQGYGINEEIDLKSSRTIFKIIKKSKSLAILSDSVVEIHVEGQKLDKLQTDSDLCYFDVPSNDKVQLLYVIVEFANYDMQKLQILEKHGILQLSKPEIINKITFPQFWLLGICKSNGDFESINTIISHSHFFNYWNEAQANPKSISRVFNQDTFLIDQSIVHNNQIIPISQDVINVMIHPDDTVMVFYEQNIQKDGKVFELGQFQAEQFCTLLPNQQVSQFNPKNTIVKVQVIFRDIFVLQNELTAIYDNNLKPKGFVKLNSYHIQQFSTNSIVTIGLQNITFFTLLITPMTIAFELKKQFRVHGMVNVSDDWSEKQLILFGRTDGILSVYDYSLQEKQHLRITNQQINQFIFIEEGLLTASSTCIYRVGVDQDCKLMILNEVNLQNSRILFVYLSDEKTKIITEKQTLTYYDINKPREYENVTQQSRLIISGCPTYTPICYYKNKQESSMKLQNQQWIVDLLDQNVRVGLQIKGSGQTVQIFLETKYCKTDLGKYKIKRSRGIWIFGVLLLKQDGHQIQEIENKCLDDDLQYELIMRMESSSACCSDEAIIVATQNELKVIDASEEIKWIYAINSVCVIRHQDDYLLLGLVDGRVQVLMKESEFTYYKCSEIQVNDKPIADILIMEGSILIASEDRKFLMLGMQNDFKVEYQEIVDKSFINNIIQLNKNLLVTGYVDGRIRLWKREKSGQQFTLNQVRTTQVMKSISKIVKVPWETNNILIGGDALLVWNMDTNKQVRQFKNTSKVSSICCIWNTMILSGCVDGQIIRWNYSTGEMIGVVLLDEPIRNLFVMREYIVTHCQNTLHLQ